VRLQSKADSLIWTGGDRTGLLTAKNVYHALAAHNWKSTIANWRQRIWRDIGPLKHKLFAWLLLENKLLFWDKLQARGWEGPNRCSLCARAIESTLHVFVQCSYTRAIWSLISSALKISTSWSGDNVLTCFQNWIQNHNTLSMLPYSCAGMFGWPEMHLFLMIRSYLSNTSHLSFWQRQAIMARPHRFSHRLGVPFNSIQIERWPGSTGPLNRGVRFVEPGGKLP
jgi:hypothetical protein